MDFEMNDEQLNLVSTWGPLAQSEAVELSPISPEVVMDWHNSGESYDSLKWHMTPGLEDHFVGVVSNLRVSNALTNLTEELVKSFDWQVDIFSNTATIKTLVIAVSEDLILERMAQMSACPDSDLLNTWVDYVLNVALYKPGLSLATLSDISSQRGLLNDTQLAEFETAFLLPEQRLSELAHTLKISRSESLHFSFEFLGNPNMKISLRPRTVQAWSVEVPF